MRLWRKSSVVTTQAWFERSRDFGRRAVRTVGMRRAQAGEEGMLILTRRVGETIRIGESVVVTVLGVKGSQVRIGIEAPRNVAVNREELYERIAQESDPTRGNR